MALLGWPAEVFYRRLHSVVDDFGRYYAEPMMLRAACYPRQLNKVTDSDVGKWLEETQKAGLVRVYAIDGQSYLELLDFRQQVRAKKSKFPDPLSTCTADAKQVIANEHLDVSVFVDVSEGGSLSGKPDPAKRGFVQEAEEVMSYLNRNAGKGFEFRNRNGDLTASADRVIARLKQGYTATELREVVFAKCEQWKHDEKMAEFLRPATLFAKENFEQYLGELKGANV
jgi:uncharacterized phage protein (TIGR02220 family)